MNNFINAIKTQDWLLVWGLGIGSIVSALAKYPQLRHRRYARVSVASSLLVLLTITLYIQDIIHAVTGVILILLFGVPSASWLFITAKRRAPLPFEKIAIDSLAALVCAGNYSLADQRFARKPFCIVSVPANLEWSFLRARAFSDQGRPRESYELLQRLLSLPLFEEERIKVEVKRVFALLLLGDTLQAKAIFERVKDALEEADRFFLEACFAERHGKLGLAREYMLRALGEAQQKKDARLARIYNNLGRMEGILKNQTDALHYYKKTAVLAKELDEKEMVHIAYPNLIDTLLLGGEYDRARSVLQEYIGLVDQSTTEELVKLYNYYLEYARQTGDQAFFLRTLVLGRMKIAPKLSFHERLAFENSELRIRWNNKSGWEEMLFVMEARLDDYFGLDFPQQYYALKEIFLILKELAKGNQFGPFGTMFDRLVRYMQEVDAVIEKHLLELPDCCVFERCYWEKERVSLLKFQKEVTTKRQYMDMLKQMIKHLQNIKDIHLQHGNPLDAIEADLNIADEVMWQTIQIGDADIATQLRPAVKQHTAEAVEAAQRFADHPRTLEYKLRIARYALFLNDRDMAMHHFEAFKDAGVSIHHYASWLQGYYEELERFFSVEKEESSSAMNIRWHGK